MSTIDLSSLPAPDVVETLDFETILASLKTTLVARMPEESQPAISATLAMESEPLTKLLEVFAYREIVLRARVNDACYATMLAYATGSDLDQIGGNFGVLRLVVTPEDDSTTPVTPAVLESDARFRQRIQQAMESWTTAGSRGSYDYHCRSASAAVRDVYITCPTFSVVPGNGVLTLVVNDAARLSNPMPGDVAITLLLEAGSDTASVHAAVAAALDPDTVIPLTDTPRLLDAEIIDYELEVTLWLYPGISETSLLSSASAALNAYTARHFMLGHDITLSALHGEAYRDGVQRVELNLTESIAVSPWQAARCTRLQVVIGGHDV
jgi:phage-related baseplate assembly protein